MENSGKEESAGRDEKNDADDENQNNDERQSILFELREWRAFITPRTAVIVLYVLGFAFIGLGTTFFVITGNMADIEVRYDDACEGKEECIVWFNTTEEISGKISIEYKLYGFYQNHRRMFESRSYAQMKGEMLDYNGLSECSPEISVNDSKSTENLYAPCGLMPLSFFNDTYEWMEKETAAFTEEGISIKSDKETLFKGINEGYNKSKRWLLNYKDFPGEVQNEHFIVWMRTAAMPTFLKLYAKCYDCTMPIGNYSIKIHMNYPTSMFSGRRALVLSTTSSLGSGSYFISTAYMSMGGISLIFATSFLIHMLVCPRQFGDLSSIWQNAESRNTPLIGANGEPTSGDDSYDHSSIDRGSAL